MRALPAIFAAFALGAAGAVPAADPPSDAARPAVAAAKRSLDLGLEFVSVCMNKGLDPEKIEAALVARHATHLDDSSLHDGSRLRHAYVVATPDGKFMVMYGQAECVAISEDADLPRTTASFGRIRNEIMASEEGVAIAKDEAIPEGAQSVGVVEYGKQGAAIRFSLFTMPVAGGGQRVFLAVKGRRLAAPGGKPAGAPSTPQDPSHAP